MPLPALKVGDSVVILKRNSLNLYGMYAVVERITPSLQTAYFYDEDFVIDVSIDDYDYLLTYRERELLRKDRPSFSRWVKEHNL